MGKKHKLYNKITSWNRQEGGLEEDQRGHLWISERGHEVSGEDAEDRVRRRQVIGCRDP